MKNHCKDIQILLIQAEANMSLLLLQLEEQKMETRSKPEKGVPVKPVPVTRNGVSFIRWVDGNGWPAPNPDKVCKGNVPKMEAIPTNVSKKFKQADEWDNELLKKASKEWIKEVKQLNIDKQPQGIKDMILESTQKFCSEFGKAFNEEVSNIINSIRQFSFSKALEDINKKLEQPKKEIIKAAQVIVPIALGCFSLACYIAGGTPAKVLKTTLKVVWAFVITDLILTLSAQAIIAQAFDENRLSEKRKKDTLKNIAKDINSVDDKLMLKSLGIDDIDQSILENLNPSLLAEFKDILSKVDINDPTSVKNAFKEIIEFKSKVDKEIQQLQLEEANQSKIGTDMNKMS